MAFAMISAAWSAAGIWTAHLLSGRIAATRSASWKASRPVKERLTWPASAIIGSESCLALWTPIAMFAVPTARVPKHTPISPLVRA